MHSSELLKKRVKEVEKEAIQNAARNPTLSTRVVLAEVANKLQTESMAVATSSSKSGTLGQAINRAR